MHQRVYIDQRTGLLAQSGTPPEAIEARVFAVHPPLYDAWMRAQGWPRPPRVTAQAASARQAAPETLSDLLRVIRPVPGTRYHLDPVLPRAHQRLELEAAVDPALHASRWWVNGVPLDGPFEGALWPLSVGRHVIEVRALTPDGLPVRSAPVEVRVLGRAPTASGS